MIAWWLIFLCVQVESVNPPVAGQSRVNYGVDFNFLYSLNNMHGSWKHIWSFEMDILDRNLDFPVNITCLPADPMCVPAQHFIETMRSSLAESSKWLHHQFEWINNPTTLSTLNRQGYHITRQKRSLLPFVGDLEKFLFGTATEGDIAGLKKTLDDMEQLHRKTIKQVTTLGENLASLTKITNDQIGNTKQGFDLVKKTFANMTTEINKRFGKIMQFVKDESNTVKYLTLSTGHTWAALETIFPQILEIVKLLMVDAQFLESIQDILQGYLPISLVPPPTLAEGLEIALQGVKEQFPDATLTYSKSMLGYYYTHKVVTPFFDGHQISLIVDIPVDLGQELLYVYSIRTFPVSILPYNPYTRTVDPIGKYGTAQSELSLKHTHFLISASGDSWSSATDAELSSCIGETIRTCKHQFAMYKFSNNQCLERIWMNNQFSEILDVCPYRLVHPGSSRQSMIHVQVVPLSNGKWYIEGPLNEPWIISCPSRPPETRTSCTSCVIQVDCGCGISSKYFKIPTRVSSCDSVFSPLHKNFTVNPFNYQPKSHPWVVNLTGDESYSYPPRMIPDIHLPDSGTWDDVLESMDSKQYDLNKLYEKQVNESRMYKTEAEALLLKIKTQDKMLESLAGWPDWILGLMLALTFGNTAVLGLLCCWFITRIHAKSLGEELNVIESTESAILDIEIIHFILTILIFILLLIVTWPVLSNWMQNTKLYRNFKGSHIRIKAGGYRKRRGHGNVILQGVGTFSPGKSSPSRMVPIQCILASVPTGTHLAHTTGPLAADIAIEEHKYVMRFSTPLITITPQEREKQCTELYFYFDYVNRKCHVPPSSRWTSITNCRIWIEG